MSSGIRVLLSKDDHLRLTIVSEESRDLRFIEREVQVVHGRFDLLLVVDLDQIIDKDARSQGRVGYWFNAEKGKRKQL